MLLEDSSGLGESDSPIEPVEEAGAQLPFELRHVLREGRLTEVQNLRRGPEASGARHREKYLDLPEGDLHKPGLIERITTRDWSLIKPALSFEVWISLRRSPRFGWQSSPRP